MTHDQEAPRAQSRSSASIVLIQMTVAAVVIAIAVIGATQLVASKPTAKKRKGGGPKRTAALVETLGASVSQEKARIDASGTVMPSQEIALHPEVAGRIVEVNPALIPGGLLRKGETVIAIDDRIYKLAVHQASSDLVKAQANVRMEKGSQQIAKREFDLLRTTITNTNEDLMLRKPQLASVMASANQARAKLSMARLDLERTKVVAPFDNVVRSRSVNVGSRVTAQTPIATLVGVDTWWIEASVPVDQLRWITVPEQPDQRGSSVRITNKAAWGPDAYRQGHVVQLAVDLEEKGRLARLIIAVDDPMSRLPNNSKQPKMLLGSWVKLEIEGNTLGPVVRVNRDLIHDGDKVWVLKGGQLDIRQVAIPFRNRDAVFVSSGLNPDEQIIVTKLPAPVQGMKLRTGEDTPDAKKPKPGAALKPKRKRKKEAQ